MASVEQFREHAQRPARLIGTLGFLLLFVPAVTSAQWFILFDRDILQFNPATGVSTRWAPAPGPVDPTLTAVDPAGHRLFVTDRRSLYVIDTRSASATKRSLSQPLDWMGLAFDAGSGMLFHVARIGDIVQIDPSNGEVRYFMTAPALHQFSPFSPGLGLTIDPSGRRLFVVDFDRIHTINLQTRSVVTAPLTNRVVGGAFDPQTGALISVSLNAFVTINPANGTVTELAPFNPPAQPEFAFEFFYSLNVDPVNRVVLFVMWGYPFGSNQTYPFNYLAVVDLSNGHVSWSQSYQYPIGAIQSEAAIPTLSAAALAVLAMILLIVAHVRAA
jgi:DNA-binding beta-propeller fold protein YncE